MDEVIIIYLTGDQKSDPTVVKPVASRYTDWATAALFFTELSLGYVNEGMGGTSSTNRILKVAEKFDCIICKEGTTSET
jgi:hypothetical protein